MNIKTLCRNCNKYYCYFDDDDGEILAEGCHLDIPLFDARKPIVCNSYIGR